MESLCLLPRCSGPLACRCSVHALQPCGSGPCSSTACSLAGASISLACHTRLTLPPASLRFPTGLRSLVLASWCVLSAPPACYCACLFAAPQLPPVPGCRCVRLRHPDRCGLLSAVQDKVRDLRVGGVQRAEAESPAGRRAGRAGDGHHRKRTALRLPLNKSVSNLSAIRQVLHGLEEAAEC